MAWGWQGKAVRLVPLDRGRHLDNAVQWLNDPEVTQWTVVGDLPMTRLAEEEYFAKAEAGQDDAVSFAIETLEGEHVGFTGLHSIEQRNGAALTGSFIGPRSLWGRGLGTDAAEVRTQYAFEVLGLRLLISEVMAENVGSLRMLAKAGYQQVGRIPERYWKRGMFRDMVLMCRRRAAPPRILDVATRRL
jgi:RimJ/RimL family protein N-acetyltransferase